MVHHLNILLFFAIFEAVVGLDVVDLDLVVEVTLLGLVAGTALVTDVALDRARALAWLIGLVDGLVVLLRFVASIHYFHRLALTDILR